MFWDRHHDMAGSWHMGIGFVIVLAFVALVVWLVVRSSNQRSGGSDSAEELLRRRFAAGEIDEEEYAKRSEVLRRR